MMKLLAAERDWRLWTDWELRLLVLVSLTLQLSLLHFGSRRRYSVKTWLRVFLWLAYLGADSVAFVALGVISNNKRNRNFYDSIYSQLQDELMAFWAPFLLLHLGGQDTITAYAVQDNELWLRHLVGLVVQSGVALYIFFLSWKVSWLSFLTIPMFLAGFIKYAERIWVLKSAKYDPIPKIMDHDEIIDRRDAYKDLQRKLPDAPNDEFRSLTPPDAPNDEFHSRLQKIKEGNVGAFPLFEIFRCLFLNRKVNMSDRLLGDYSNFNDYQTAWATIEHELGYAYDVYYTKASLFFTAWGFLIRFFSFTSILFVFVLFVIEERHKPPQIDLIITYLLFVGAILIEIYAVILLCASDWPWPRYKNGWLINCIKTLFTPIRNGSSKRRWSKSMGQLGLLSVCLEDKYLQAAHGTPTLFANVIVWAFNFPMLPKLNGQLEIPYYICRTHKEVSDGLKYFVFNTFREKLNRNEFFVKECTVWVLWEILNSNSNGFSEEYDKYITNESVNVETYQSIIIWHIATDICFYTDSGTNDSNLGREVSKDVSDYMMYILVMVPFLLSTRNAILGFENTCALVRDFFLAKGLSRQVPLAQVCRILISDYDASSDLAEVYLLKDSLISLAVLLAKNLNQMDGKWELLSKFWVENLAYVATLCPGTNHAQLLKEGGEFLTHVWLLIEHFNLTTSFRKSRTRPQNEEEKVSPRSESGGSATGLVSESGYGHGSGNGSAAVSGTYAS